MPRLQSLDKVAWSTSSAAVHTWGCLRRSRKVQRSTGLAVLAILLLLLLLSAAVLSPFSADSTAAVRTAGAYCRAAVCSVCSAAYSRIPAGAPACAGGKFGPQHHNYSGTVGPEVEVWQQHHTHKDTVPSESPQLHQHHPLVWVQTATATARW